MDSRRDASDTAASWDEALKRAEMEAWEKSNMEKRGGAEGEEEDVEDEEGNGGGSSQYGNSLDKIPDYDPSLLVFDETHPVEV